MEISFYGISDRSRSAHILPIATGEYVSSRFFDAMNRSKFFDELFVPELKHEQRPRFLITRILPLLLQTHNFLYSLRIEELFASGMAREQGVTHKIPELEPQPAIGGNWKTLLPPMQDRPWQLLCHGLSQDPFPLVLAHFHVVRQTGNVFHQFVIQKRHTKLDRSGHRHLVSF